MSAIVIAAPPPPDSHLVVALFLVGVLGIIAVQNGCTPGEPRIPAYCTDEKAFTATLLRCVDKSPTKAASRACRKQVHEACGITETVTGGRE